MEQKIRVSSGLVTQDLLQSVGRECLKRWLKCLKIVGSHVEVQYLVNKLTQRDIRMVICF